MIHICYGLHDRDGHYSKFTGTSMLSIFENTAAPANSITIHILHDNTLTRENHDNFVYIAGRYNQNVKFHNVEKLCADKIQFLHEKLAGYVNSRFSIGAFYRLFVSKKFFIPENVSRVIYLDADTIVNLDIAELWNYPLDGHTLAAVPEHLATHERMITDKYLLHAGIVEREDYFCSGIIMLDLDKLDENFSYEGIQWLAEHTECASPDQDILNNFFAADYCKLPMKFDDFVLAVRLDNITTADETIYHYAGQTAVTFDMQDAYNRLFFQNFIKTPWFNMDLIENAFNFTRNMYLKLKIFSLQIAKSACGKARAFFLTQGNLKAAKNIFDIQNSEEVIIANSNDALEKLIRSMKKAKGKKVFFVMANYAVISAELINAGFSENKDFINAMAFLSDNNGVPMQTYPYLRAL